MYHKSNAAVCSLLCVAFITMGKYQIQSNSNLNFCLVEWSNASFLSYPLHLYNYCTDFTRSKTRLTVTIHIKLACSCLYFLLTVTLPRYQYLPQYQLLSCIDDISAHDQLTAETVYPLWTVANDPITSLVLYWQQLRDGQTTHTNWSKKAVCTPIIHYSTLDIWSIKVNTSPWLPCGVLCQYPSVLN